MSDYALPLYIPDLEGQARREAHLREVEEQLASLPALRARLALQEFCAVDLQREPNAEELREIRRVRRAIRRVA